MAGGVMLSTLCLNEMEWLPSLYEQHKNWPDLVKWVFIEAADRAYAECNPRMVSELGLSMDRTGHFLEEVEDRDPRVTYVSYGFTDHVDPAKGKAPAKQVALDIAEDVKPEFFFHLDADEFYTYEHQAKILEMMRTKPRKDSFIFNRREIWRPPTVLDSPLFRWEVIGGFWELACCHWYRWQPGMHHRDCHNTPSNARGYPMNRNIFDTRDKDHRRVEGMPEMVHMGFASQNRTRLAKNRYYAYRGETDDPKRSWYVHSRACWEDWQPNTVMPRGARVIDYDGPVPEVFRHGVPLAEGKKL